MNSETSFTPGPWEIRPKKAGNLVHIAAPSKSNWFIAENILPKDATLIAAAPDMYEGLQEAVLELQAVADSLFEGGCGGQGMETTISKYEAILAKARGDV